MSHDMHVVGLAFGCLVGNDDDVFELYWLQGHLYAQVQDCFCNKLDSLSLSHLVSCGPMEEDAVQSRSALSRSGG